MRIKTPLFPKPIYFHGSQSGDDGPIEFEVAMQWNDAYTETIYPTSTILRHAKGEPI